MTHIQQLSAPVADVAGEALMDHLVQLAIKAFCEYAQENQSRQKDLTVTDSDNDQIFYLSFRRDRMYLSYFETLSEVLVNRCCERDLSVLTRGTDPMSDFDLAESGCHDAALAIIDAEQRRLSSKIAQIEGIHLHECLRGQGLFSDIVARLLQVDGIEFVLVTHIVNERWFSALAPRALETNTLYGQRSVLLGKTS